MLRLGVRRTFGVVRCAPAGSAPALRGSELLCGRGVRSVFGAHGAAPRPAAVGPTLRMFSSGEDKAEDGFDIDFSIDDEALEAEGEAAASTGVQGSKKSGGGRDRPRGGEASSSQGGDFERVRDFGGSVTYEGPATAMPVLDDVVVTAADAREMDDLARAIGFDVHAEEGGVMAPSESGEIGGPRVWSAAAMHEASARTSRVPPNPYAPAFEFHTEEWQTERPPAEQTAENVGQYYTISEEDASSLFPEGVAGDIADEWELIGERRVQVRREAVAIVQQLERLRQGGDLGESEESTLLKVLDGPSGAGKSAILNHVVHYARSNGWIVMFVPSCRTLMETGGVLVKSRSRPGKVDQHDLARDILVHMKAAHGEQLESIPQRGTYPKHFFLPESEDAAAVQLREQLRKEDEEERRRLRAQAQAEGRPFDRSEFVSKLKAAESDTSIDRSGFTLADMVDWGVRHPAMATDAFLALRSELAQVTEFPVLLAMDGINAMYDVDETVYPWEGEWLRPEQLTLLDALRVVDESGLRESAGMKRGAIVATTSRAANKHTRIFNVARGAKKHRVQVRSLDRFAVNAALSHYASTGSFYELERQASVEAPAASTTTGELDGDAPVQVSKHQIEYFRMLTSGNARELYKCAMYIG